VFRLHVLPAGVGDALVLDYGTESEIHRVVIDGGVGRIAQPLADFLGPTPQIEMGMISHVDNDHIAGLLKMLETGLTSATIGDFWFNGFRHLPESGLEQMGPVEGERLTTFLVDHAIPWNANPAFAGGAVTRGTGDEPLVATLPGGLACRVLSPGRQQLSKLRPKWAPAVREADLDPAAPVAEEEPRPPSRLERMGAPDLVALAADRTPEDNKEANGSSIAILATWAGRTALLTGDAHSDVLLETLDRWLGPTGTLEVDLFKLPHHGSKANVTDALTKRVRAKCYVFSSSGQGRSQHPNDPAVARVIINSAGDRVLAFNYRNKRTEMWGDASLRAQWGYRTLYPGAEGEGEGVMIDLLEL
jgi:beta-lactamase superfamily II metal-dependent hydrolase